MWLCPCKTLFLKTGGTFGWWDVQLALCNCGFYISGFNQLRIKNIWKIKIPESPQTQICSSIWIVLRSFINYLEVISSEWMCQRLCKYYVYKHYANIIMHVLWHFIWKTRVTTDFGSREGVLEPFPSEYWRMTVMCWPLIYISGLQIYDVLGITYAMDWIVSSQRKIGLPRWH